MGLREFKGIQKHKGPEETAFASVCIFFKDEYGPYGQCQNLQGKEILSEQHLREFTRLEKMVASFLKKGKHHRPLRVLLHLLRRYTKPLKPPQFTPSEGRCFNHFGPL